MSESQTPNADRLIRSTVKIVARNEAGLTSDGSGVLMMLQIFGPDNQDVAPVVVTNKHVVENAVRADYTVPGANGGPPVTAQAPAHVILHHPDPEVDLCVIPVPAQMMQQGLHDAEFLSSADIWRMDRLRTLTAIERVYMIGYPNGLVDRKALYPIARQGITATPAFADFHGQTEFMIDCACFPGSSGSPVFLLDQGFHVDRSNNYQFGATRFGLLGFLHAGPALNEEDDVVAVAPPKKLEDIVKYPLMMNLGNCVRAERLFDMFDLIARAGRR